MRIVKTVVKYLPHAGIILSLMFLTFAIIDTMNNSMGFLDNKYTRALIFVWAVVTLLESAYIVWRTRSEARREYDDAVREHPELFLPPELREEFLKKTGRAADTDEKKSS